MKKRTRNTAIILFLLAILIIVITIFGGIIIGYKKGKPLSYDQFKEQVKLEQKSQTIGTNITLHQVIYGKDGKRYRYKLKSDCPNWQYEDRYLSDVPLEMKEKESAIETEAVSLKIRLDGDLLADGQYFYIPLLNLRSEDITQEEFETNLMKSAYVAYEASGNRDLDKLRMFTIVCAMAMFLIFLLSILNLRNGKKQEDEKGSLHEIRLLTVPVSDNMFIAAVPNEKTKNAVYCIEKAVADYEQDKKLDFENHAKECLLRSKIPVIFSALSHPMTKAQKMYLDECVVKENVIQCSNQNKERVRI